LGLKFLGFERKIAKTKKKKRERKKEKGKKFENKVISSALICKGIFVVNTKTTISKYYKKFLYYDI
jgi:hypothetical protein